jgi:hypothetical protein
MYNTYIVKGDPKKTLWGTLARSDYWWYSKTTVPSLLVPSLPNMVVHWPSEGAVGSHESIPMWGMVLVRHWGYWQPNHSDGRRPNIDMDYWALPEPWYGMGMVRYIQRPWGIHLTGVTEVWSKETDRCPLTSPPFQRCIVTTCKDLQLVARSAWVKGMELKIAVLICRAAPGLSQWKLLWPSSYIPSIWPGIWGDCTLSDCLRSSRSCILLCCRWALEVEEGQVSGLGCSLEEQWRVWQQERQNEAVKAEEVRQDGRLHVWHKLWQWIALIDNEPVSMKVNWWLCRFHQAILCHQGQRQALAHVNGCSTLCTHILPLWELLLPPQVPSPFNLWTYWQTQVSTMPAEARIPCEGVDQYQS